MAVFITKSFIEKTRLTIISITGYLSVCLYIYLSPNSLPLSHPYSIATYVFHIDLIRFPFLFTRLRQYRPWKWRLLSTSVTNFPFVFKLVSSHKRMEMNMWDKEKNKETAKERERGRERERERGDLWRCISMNRCVCKNVECTRYFILFNVVAFLKQ